MLIGSEGELTNVAADFDTFLLAWLNGKCGIGDLDEEAEEVESARPALAKWLAVEGATASRAKVPPFKSWFRKTVEAAIPKAAREEAAKAAHALLASAERVEVDVALVRRRAPKALPLPERLERFAEWLARAPRGGLTDCSLSLCASPDPVANDELVDEALREHIVYFLRAREIGSVETTEIGLFDHGGDEPAVVARMSETDVRTIAPGLDAFLFAWSRGATGVADLDDGGDEATRAELAAWLAKEGAKDAAKKSAKKLPDVAAWTEKVIAEVNAKRRPAKQLTVPKKPPADMAERSAGLLGKAKDDPAVVSFCAALGIDIEATTEDDVLKRLFMPKHGFSLGFRALEDGAGAGPRVFYSVRFHRKKHRWWSYALGRDVSFSEFPCPLPRGIQFTWSRAEVLAAVGPTTKEDDDCLQWTDAQTGVTLVVDFASQWDKIPAGEICCVWITVGAR